MPGSDTKTGLYNYKEVDRVTSTVYRTDLPTHYDSRNGGRSGDDPILARQRLPQAYDQDYSKKTVEKKPYELLLFPLKTKKL